MTITSTQKIKVYKIENVTPGARHVWYHTDVGRIRKPIGQLANLDFSELDDKIVLVERELLNWGSWLVKCTIGGMGYPKQSTTVTALQGSPSTSTPNLPTNSDAERVESVVKRIEKDNKTWSDVLRKHYMREDGQTADQVAASLEMPARTYRYNLNLARKRVEYLLKND